jgi:hypothetical protein
MIRDRISQLSGWHSYFVSERSQVLIAAWVAVGVIEIFHGFLQFPQAAAGIYRPTTAFPIHSDQLLDHTTILYCIRGVAKLTEH